MRRFRNLAAALTLWLAACAGAGPSASAPPATELPATELPAVVTAASAGPPTAAPVILSLPVKLRFIEFFAGT